MTHILAPRAHSFLPSELDSSSLPHVQIEEISPERAQYLFGHRAKNRTFNHGRARRWARDMQAGVWELSPDAVSINVEAGLDNAQHRMWAVAESGLPQQFLVLYHRSPTLFAVMDSGAKRTLANMLDIQGYPYYSVLASAVTRIHTYSRIEHFKTEGYRNVSEKDALRWVESHREMMIEMAKLSQETYRYTKFPRSIACACAYLFGLVSTDDRDDFFRKLNDCDYQPNAIDPIVGLRSRLLRNAGLPTHSPRKVDEVVLAAYAIKAWNAYLDGTSIEQFKWSTGGARPESFPKIRGLDKSRVWTEAQQALAPVARLC